MAEPTLLNGSGQPEGGGNKSASSGANNDIISKISHQTSGEFDLLKNAYSEQVAIGVREGAVGSINSGTPSLFNPFQIFRYSGFGTSSEYNVKKHFDTNSGDILNVNKTTLLGNSNSGGTITSYTDKVKSGASKFLGIKGASDDAENPTASTIIKWSHNQTLGDNIPVAPYAMTDFLWCTNYGKIPNNRLVTLRRYTIPVNDNLAINERKMPQVPVAQAVTWFGKDVDNPLNNILSLKWGFGWEDKPAKMQDIDGNEIPLDALSDLIGGPGNEKLKEFIKLLVANGEDINKLTGVDKLAQQWIRGSYGDEGPYWNRVLGPVNVVDRTQIRTRGLTTGYQEDVTLKFNYSLRSYSLINPKIAFLDLLSNFLSLTYNTAPFWGGGVRYFKKTGLTFSAFPGYEKLMDGDIVGSGADALDAAAKVLKEGSTSITAVINGLLSGDKAAKDKAGNLISEKSNVYLASRIKEANILQAPLLIRSILDGRAVGEWHVTIGNPMNPIAAIGNLCMDSTTMKFKNDALGIDDFPTEVEFTVKLKHGRPRAMQDIESMFNLGNGQMTRSPLTTPGETNQNSYGVNKSIRQNAAFNGEDISKKVDPQTNKPYVNLSAEEKNQLQVDVTKYGARVNRFYGPFFANSKIIPEYFLNLNTKD